MPVRVGTVLLFPWFHAVESFVIDWRVYNNSSNSSNNAEPRADWYAHDTNKPKSSRDS